MENCSTDKRLQQETLCRRQWTDEYVERPDTLMRQNVVVVWLRCLQVDVAEKLNSYLLVPFQLSRLILPFHELWNSILKIAWIFG